MITYGCFSDLARNPKVVIAHGKCRPSCDPMHGVFACKTINAGELVMAYNGQQMIDTTNLSNAYDIQLYGIVFKRGRRWILVCPRLNHDGLPIHPDDATDSADCSLAAFVNEPSDTVRAVLKGSEVYTEETNESRANMSLRIHHQDGYAVGPLAYAIRDILPGEELVWDYGNAYERVRWRFDYERGTATQISEYRRVISSGITVNTAEVYFKDTSAESLNLVNHSMDAYVIQGAGTNEQKIRMLKRTIIYGGLQGAGTGRMCLDTYVTRSGADEVRDDFARSFRLVQNMKHRCENVLMRSARNGTSPIDRLCAVLHAQIPHRTHLLLDASWRDQMVNWGDIHVMQHDFWSKWYDIQDGVLKDIDRVFLQMLSPEHYAHLAAPGETIADWRLLDPKIYGEREYGLEFFSDIQYLRDACRAVCTPACTPPITKRPPPLLIPRGEATLTKPSISPPATSASSLEPTTSTTCRTTSWSPPNNPSSSRVHANLSEISEHSLFSNPISDLPHVKLTLIGCETLCSSEQSFESNSHSTCVSCSWSSGSSNESIESRSDSESLPTSSGPPLQNCCEIVEEWSNILADLRAKICPDDIRQYGYCIGLYLRLEAMNGPMSLIYQMRSNSEAPFVRQDADEVVMRWTNLLVAASKSTDTVPLTITNTLCEASTSFARIIRRWTLELDHPEDDFPADVLQEYLVIGRHMHDMLQYTCWTSTEAASLTEMMNAYVFTTNKRLQDRHI